MSSSHALLFCSWPLNSICRRQGVWLYIYAAGNEHAWLWVKVNGSQEQIEAASVCTFRGKQQGNLFFRVFLWLCGVPLANLSWQSMRHKVLYYLLACFSDQLQLKPVKQFSFWQTCMTEICGMVEASPSPSLICSGTVQAPPVDWQHPLQQRTVCGVALFCWCVVAHPSDCDSY